MPRYTPVQSTTGRGTYIGAFAGMSAARVTLVSAAMDTVASKNRFIGSNLVAPLSLFACHAAFRAASSDRMTRLRFPRRMWRIRNVELQPRARLTTEFPMNIVEPILFQARHDPPAPAMCAPGTALGIVSYARLARFIHSVGHRAVRLGVAPGQIVAIHVSDHIVHAALALGFTHLGVVTVSIGATLPPNLRADIILTDKPEAFGNTRSKKVVAVDLSWMSGKGVPVEERYVYRGNGND